MQSNLLLRTFDNKALHAPIELKDGDRVLDTGTGTGMFFLCIGGRGVPNSLCKVSGCKI